MTDKCQPMQRPDNVDELVDGYIAYLKLLPPKMFYAFYYGTFGIKNKALNAYLARLHLSYTAYQAVKQAFDDIDGYLDLHLEAPPKKVVAPKRKAVLDSDDEAF